MAALARRAEQLGFQQIWICDHYHNRYVHSVLAQLATETQRVQLGPGVTNPYLVHPTVTAAAIATLNELSRGRAILGLSSGDPVFLETVGIKQFKPLTTVREAVYIIRKLLKGEKVEFMGESLTCHGAKLRFKPANKVPIYVGGRRQRMLQLAGEVADGALINASHPADIKECVSYVREGLKNSKRSKDKFDIVAYMAVSVDNNEEKALEAARGVVAFLASSAPEESLAHQDIREYEVEKVRGFLMTGDIQRARKAVTREMLEEFSVCGKVEKLVSKVEELKKIGVTNTVIGSPIGPNPIKSIELVAKNLI